jgi:hypothetical protein
MAVSAIFWTTVRGAFAGKKFPLRKHLGLEFRHQRLRTERLFSSSCKGDLCRSIHSTCLASRSQPFATSSKARFKHGSLACAARSLASAALSRYLSARSDKQGERQARRSGSFGAARLLAIRNRVRRHRAGAMVDAASKKAPASLYRGFK